MAAFYRNGNLKMLAGGDQALPRLCCTPVGTEVLLLSAPRDKTLEKSLNRSVFLDLGLEVLSEARHHATCNGAGDLLGRRFAGFVVLFNEESFIESLDVGVGFFCHRF